MVESSVTFVSLIISEQKCPLLRRQPPEDGTYWVLLFSGSVLCTPCYLHFLKEQLCNGVSVSSATPFFIVIWSYKFTGSWISVCLSEFFQYEIRSCKGSSDLQKQLLFSCGVKHWPREVSSESPLGSVEPVYLLPDLNSTTQLSILPVFKLSPQVIWALYMESKLHLFHLLETDVDFIAYPVAAVLTGAMGLPKFKWTELDYIPCNSGADLRALREKWESIMWWQ